MHDLERQNLEIALSKIMRVSKKYITFAWNLTAKTIMSVEEWKKLFEKAKYQGDYYWFVP